MNFGQVWRTQGIVDVDYRVELPREFLHEVLARVLPEYVDDCRKFPDADEPFEVALRERSWPDAQRAMEDEPVAVLALRYLATDLLSEWLGDGPPSEEPGYVLNSVDHVGVGDGPCWIEGKCRRSQPEVKYQDV